MATHPIVDSLQKLNVLHFDDGTLADKANTVFEDLNTLKNEFSAISLNLNFSKCEIFRVPSVPVEVKDYIIKKFQASAPYIKTLNVQSLHLLGALLLDESIPVYIEDKLSKLQ